MEFYYLDFNVHVSMRSTKILTTTLHFDMYHIFSLDNINMENAIILT